MSDGIAVHSALSNDPSQADTESRGARCRYTSDSDRYSEHTAGDCFASSRGRSFPFPVPILSGVRAPVAERPVYGLPERFNSLCYDVTSTAVNVGHIARRTNITIK